MIRPATNTPTVLSHSALALLVTGAVLYAGPLNPPAGPVASTYKTLTEVEPRIAINATNTPGDADSLFKITQPGSYYLTGNVTGVSGKRGIEIAASGVTLDLNGFDLAGVSGSLDGVSTSVADLRHIAVLNGSIRNWGGDGVDLSTARAIGCRVEKVHASGNGATGIITGVNATVTASTAYQNTSTGIVTLTGGTVTNCVAYQNALNGINGNSGCVITACMAYDNSGDGISANAGAVTGCTAYSNIDSGLVGVNSCSFTACVSYANGSHGITTLSGGTVAHCTVRANTADGIRCTSNCLILDNNAGSNGSGAGDGANIHATGADNRIEGNNCSAADRGIDVDVSGNIIIRNTCSGNTTNWDVVAGNIILVVQGTSAGAILGNTGGVAPGSTDPNANFSY